MGGLQRERGQHVAGAGGAGHDHEGVDDGQDRARRERRDQPELAVQPRDERDDAAGGRRVHVRGGERVAARGAGGVLREQRRGEALLLHRRGEAGADGDEAVRGDGDREHARDGGPGVDAGGRAERGDHPGAGQAEPAGERRFEQPAAGVRGGEDLDGRELLGEHGERGAGAEQDDGGHGGDRRLEVLLLLLRGAGEPRRVVHAEQGLPAAGGDRQGHGGSHREPGVGRLGRAPVGLQEGAHDESGAGGRLRVLGV